MFSPLTPYNCPEKLLSSGYMSDITFYVGENKANSTRFPAHKLFMSFASPVFSAMLGDKFIENKTGEVLITDVTPLAFNALLRFIYTGEFSKNITILEYTHILYAAKKYMMEPLTNCCFENLVKRAVNFDNFWSFYYIVHTFFSELMPADLVINTLSFLSGNSVELLCYDECCNLSSDIVGKIVESEAVKVDSEITVINFILNWSRMECNRQKLDVTFDNRRKVLGDIIYKVRFLTLSMFELKNQSELLSKEEYRVCTLSDKDNDILNPWNKKFLETKRVGTSSDICWVGEPSIVSDPPVKNYKISIISAKNCIFNYLRLTSSSCDKLFIKGKISRGDGEIVKQFNCCYGFRNANQTTDLSVKICLNAFTFYILDIEFENGTLSKNKYNLHYCLDKGETLFIVEEWPDCKQYEAKSVEYWQSVFKNKQNVKQLDSFVNGINVTVV